MSHNYATQGRQVYIDQILIAAVLIWVRHILHKGGPTTSIKLKAQPYCNTSLYTIYSALKLQATIIFLLPTPALGLNQG